MKRLLIIATIAAVFLFGVGIDKAKASTWKQATASGCNSTCDNLDQYCPDGTHKKYDCTFTGTTKLRGTPPNEVLNCECNCKSKSCPKTPKTEASLESDSEAELMNALSNCQQLMEENPDLVDELFAE